MYRVPFGNEFILKGNLCISATVAVFCVRFLSNHDGLRILEEQQVHRHGCV